MTSIHNISDAGLYTDFSGLQQLRNKAESQETSKSSEAIKQVARQFESLFLQMMLKSMRDATATITATGEAAESDQTRFYQEMFDKQIALDLASNEKGYGLGIAAILERDMKVTQQGKPDVQVVTDDVELIRYQINRPGSSIQLNSNAKQE